MKPRRVRIVIKMTSEWPVEKLKLEMSALASNYFSAWGDKLHSVTVHPVKEKKR
jgi:hypothetical protein